MAPAESKRSILLVTNDLGPHAGGIETFILGLINFLDGNKLVIYTSKEEGSVDFDKKLLQERGAIVIRDKSKVLLPTRRVQNKAISILKDFQCEVVWFGAAAPLALMAKNLKRAGAKKTVALTHGHEVWWAKLPIFKSLLRKIGEGCDVITYLGDFTRDSIKRALGKNPNLVHIAPGIDTDVFNPNQKSEQLIKELSLENQKVIVSVGRLVRRKGQDKLIKAMPEILKNIPDSKLLLVGQGKYQKNLEKLVSKLNLQNSVIFVGRVAYRDLPKYFLLGDLFAMPCRSRLKGLEVEGLGIVFLEASSCGIPVLAGDSGGAPDAVIDGETGYVVNGKSVNEISGAAIELLSNPEKLEKMGARGRQWALEYWTWKNWGNRFKDILDI